MVSSRCVWITGSSRGIGRALVETAPSSPARIIGVGRGHAPALPPRSGTEYEHVTADLSTPGGWDRLDASFVQELRSQPELAVLLHCAAVVTPMKFAGDAPSPEYKQAVLLNAAAPQIIGEAFLRTIARQGAGIPAVIVMLSSGSTSRLYPGWSAYKAGKAAVDAWVRAAAAKPPETTSQPVILSITPGVVATDMQEEIRRTSERDFPQRARFDGLHAKGQLADPHAVAERIWHLIENLPQSGSVIDLREA